MRYMGDDLLLDVMKTKLHSIRFRHCASPVVEFDPAAEAWYIRMGTGSVARTIELNTQSVTATCDLDAAGNVIGLELIGVKEFSIRQLRTITKENGLELPQLSSENLRFKPTHQPATECVA